MHIHQRNAHGDENKTNVETSSQTHSVSVNSMKMTFQHPFTMVVPGPSGSGKTKWTRKLFLSSLNEPSPEIMAWCFRQKQPLYTELQRGFRSIEFVRGIPEYLNKPRYIDVGKRNVLVLVD